MRAGEHLFLLGSSPVRSAIRHLQVTKSVSNDNRSCELSCDLSRERSRLRSFRALAGQAVRVCEHRAHNPPGSRQSSANPKQKEPGKCSYERKKTQNAFP